MAKKTQVKTAEELDVVDHVLAAWNAADFAADSLVSEEDSADSSLAAAGLGVLAATSVLRRSDRRRRNQ